MLGAAAQDAEDAVLRLPLGPAALRGKTLAVTPGVTFAAAKGKAVTFDRMIGSLKKSRLVYVGETHDSLPMHDVQAAVIEALAAVVPKLSIGLEMLPVGFQPVLDRWSRGELSEDELIRETRWYLTWNFNFGYYRRIFLFAKDNGIPIYGLNSPRENVSTVRMKGWDA
ncbi:MAG: ChaN family lipoprotein, partial [Candidatus Aminicenantes bacterium]|nr:ChaN family lipoprotein [Candidatus Aminicenantes bacterium]